MKKRWRAHWLVMTMLGLIYFIPGQSSAQSKAVTHEELANRATVVAVGKVASLQSEWTSDRAGIVTRVNVAVDEFLKGGREDRTLTITVPGGEVDGVGEMYTHAATFQRDEEVVVFAESDAQGNLRVTEGAAGKMVITRDAATGRKVIGRNQPLEVLTTLVKSAVKASRQE